MSFTVDRFETNRRDSGGRVTSGWRVTRYSWGTITIQHLRSGRCYSGVVDDFGDVIWPENHYHWTMSTEETVPFYRDGMLPPHWKPGMPYKT